MKIVIDIIWGATIWTAIAAIVAIPTWFLWNWLVPTLFDLPSISVAQALGLVLLAGCLFGSRPTVKFES